MGARTKVARFQRVDLPDGRYYLTTADGGRTGRSNLQFFDAAQAPAFEGREAWFECELVRGGVRIVRVLRQVPPPAGYVAPAALQVSDGNHNFSTPPPLKGPGGAL